MTTRRSPTTAACCAVACAGIIQGTLVPAGAAERRDGIDIIAYQSRPGDVDDADYAGTHTRIDGDVLTRRDVTLDDVLARESGVQKLSSGGFGSFAAITVRAASAAQTSLLLDGVRLNSAGSPVVDLSTLDLLNLAAIDVYRGITPIEFGAGAIGGAVNLATPRVDPQEPVTRIGLALGSFGYRRGEVAHLARHGRWDTVATLSGTQSDNDFKFTDDNATPFNREDDRRERRNNADASRIGALVKLATTHESGAASDVLLQLGRRRLGVPEWRNAADNRARFDTDTLQLQLGHARDVFESWRTRQTLYLHAEDNRFDDRESQVGLGRQDTASESRTLGVDSAWTRPLGPGTVTLKGELRRESLHGRDRIGQEPDTDARRDVLALGLQWTGYHPGGRLVVVPGLTVRHDSDRFDRDGGATPDEDLQVRRDATTLAPALGVRFDARETLTLRASAARYSREPSFAELFIDRGLVRGNPALEAERGVNVDAGVDWRPASVLTVGATVFASERDEQIVTVFDTRGVGRSVNSGSARVLGLELASRWQPVRLWTLAANLTWQEAANRSDNPVLDDKQLPGEARLRANAALHVRPTERWLLRLEGDIVRDRFYDQANRRPADDSALAHAGIDYSRGDWNVALALTNLGDRIVEDFNGFPRPGRAVNLNVNLAL